MQKGKARGVGEKKGARALSMVLYWGYALLYGDWVCGLQMRSTVTDTNFTQELCQTRILAG